MFVARAITTTTASAITTTMTISTTSKMLTISNDEDGGGDDDSGYDDDSCWHPFQFSKWVVCVPVSGVLPRRHLQPARTGWKVGAPSPKLGSDGLGGAWGLRTRMKDFRNQS